MTVSTNETYPLWIDVNSGAWGDTSGLRLIPYDDIVKDLENASDEQIANIGNSDGDNVQTALDNAIDNSDVVVFTGNLEDAVSRLYYAAEAILEALGVDPSEPCKLCDTTFGFHTSECPTHDMNIATDAVAEWVR